MLEEADFPAEVASIALFSILRVSPTDMPAPAADSFEAAICCNDRANGSNAALAAGAAGAGAALAIGAVEGLEVAFVVGLRLANEGSTLPVVVGLIVVGNLPNGCVPGPLAAAVADALPDLSDAATEVLSTAGAGDVRRFFRLSVFSLQRQQHP